MYLGIDLGTSNSAVFGHRDGRLELCKALGGEDVLPSVVMLDRSGSRYVGRRAYEQLRIAPEGIAAKFKRLLGTNSVLPFGHEGGAITPEEASTEVVRQLLRQAQARFGDEPVQGAIVTVPAAFNQLQSEATIRAANAAGLDKVGLLQEPIAAAMACMERPESRDGLFLIYDLGGGTLDVALVRAIAGAVTVEAHEGINMLGGSDFDRLIVDEVVRPWLRSQFRLSADDVDDPAMRRIVALARANAEQAKMELSSASEALIFVSERELQVSDLDGRPVYLEVPLSRAQLEAIVAPKIDRSIELCRKVLADNGYGPADVSKVMLIGGPSRMPVVRRRVPEELGIAIDLDIDPMTAVARGAAIYAESRQWGSGEADSGGKKSRVRQDSGSAVSYDFEARTTRDKGRIRVMSTGDTTGWRVTAAGSDGRNYGERLVGESPIFTIELAEGDNTVAMEVFDAAGQRVAEASTALVLTRIAAVASGAPCTATIGVKVEDTDGTRSINVLDALIEKGENLPKRGTRTLRAARRLDPGAQDWIDVELYEMAPDVPEPEANLLVGSFRLAGTDLPAHVAPLMPGDEVVLHWAVDDNQLIRCSVELPGHGLHLRDHSFYVDDLARIDFGRDGRAFASEAMLHIVNDYEDFTKAAADLFPRETRVLEARITEQLAILRHTHDADGFRSITEEARMIRQEISRLRNKPDAKARVLEQQLYEAEQRGRGMSGMLDAAGTREADGHLDLARRALDERQLQVCDRAIAAAQAVYNRYYVQNPAAILAHYMHVREQAHLALDRNRFDRLVQQGDVALGAGDHMALRSVLVELYSIMPAAAGNTTDAAALAGLRR